MSRRPRRQNRTTITLEGWYFLGIMGFILAGALLRHMNLLILLFGLMLGPMYVNWRIVAHSLRKIRVSRSAPSSIVAGEKTGRRYQGHQRRQTHQLGRAG